jgi:hypothetical protein
VTYVTHAVLALLLALSSAQVVTAQELRVPIAETSRAATADPSILRMHAGSAMAARLNAPAGATHAMVAAWLASDHQSMSVESVSAVAGTAEAVCVDHAATATRVAALADQVREFGAPVVLVEAERPENPSDLHAAASVQQSLAQLGLIAIDSQAAHAHRRAGADAAVREGLDPGAARAAIDRLDVDFILRIRWSRREESDIASYGILLSSCEVTLAPTLLRSSDHSSLPADAGIGVGRSRAARAAESDAERLALDAVTHAVMRAVSVEWIALAMDERAWVIEVHGVSGGVPTAVERASRGDEVVVLEDRPGIGALMKASPEAARRVIAESEPGTVLQRRPGFLLVARDTSESPDTFPWWVGVVIALVVAVGMGLTMRNSRVSALPGLAHLDRLN